VPRFGIDQNPKAARRRRDFSTAASTIGGLEDHHAERDDYTPRLVFECLAWENPAVRQFGMVPDREESRRANMSLHP
jgi:hypothetical protein